MRLTRSDDRKIAGVCAGIAEYFGWDTYTVRMICLFATIFMAFSGVGIYLLLWLVMPERDY